MDAPHRSRAAAGFSPRFHFSRGGRPLRLLLLLLCLGIGTGCNEVVFEAGGEALDPSTLKIYAQRPDGTLHRITHDQEGVHFLEDRVFLHPDVAPSGLFVVDSDLGSGFYDEFEAAQSLIGRSPVELQRLSVVLAGHRDRDGDGTSDYEELMGFAPPPLPGEKPILPVDQPASPSSFLPEPEPTTTSDPTPSGPISTDPPSAALDEGSGATGDPLAGATSPSPVAFPGAEGFGAQSRGGRGGRVIPVTSLEDRGPGTLRAALEASGPRIVVFHVGGTIEVNERIAVTNPFVTVAGQTAPGEGIAIRSGPDLGLEPIRIVTHDVVVRHIRVRPGPTHDPSCCNDGIRIGGDPNDPKSPAVYNVILDHVSTSWASGENISIGGSGTRGVTVQWSILSEPIAHNHIEMLKYGPQAHHDCALLVSGGAGDVSIHHNLIAHSGCRSPRIVMGEGRFDLVNNVIFDWASDHSHWRVATELHSGAGHSRDLDGILKGNVVSNYYKLPEAFQDLERPHVVSISNNQGRMGKVHVEGNQIAHIPGSELDQTLVVNRTGPGFTRDRRHGTPPVSTTSAEVAYAMVLDEAGATLPERDKVDARAVRDTERNRHRSVEYDPSEVGGWPFMNGGLAPLDTDGDGMPDGWEHDHDFDLRDPRDGPGDADGDGYTNVEEYLNATDPYALD